MFIIYKNDNFQQIVSYHLVTVNDFHWVLKPVSRSWKL